MTNFNLGSINIDYMYSVDAFPDPGETLTAKALKTGLGGKGANQSIAIARAGGQVTHIGAVGLQDNWTIDLLKKAGVNTEHIHVLETPTGHAVINVDKNAENTIVLYGGANLAIKQSHIDSVLAEADTSDWLLLQNETSGGLYAAQKAKSLGIKIAYCAAPFDKDTIENIVHFCDILAVNEIEWNSIQSSLPELADRLNNISVLVTKGSQGASLITGTESISVDALDVQPLDTTGAGDTFLGYFLESVDAGLSVKVSLERASAASAVQITRSGAANAIPTTSEVEHFLESYS